MGQRLNIEIHNNEGVIANCYYHWSGYTNISLDILEKILNHYKYIKQNKIETSDKVLAYLLLSHTGASIPKGEPIPNELIDLHNFKEFDRNKGLIAFSDYGINETRIWEEGRITINISKETFEFDVFGLFNQNEFDKFFPNKSIDDVKEIAKEVSFDDFNIYKYEINTNELFYNDFKLTEDTKILYKIE